MMLAAAASKTRSILVSLFFLLLGGCSLLQHPDALVADIDSALEPATDVALLKRQEENVARAVERLRRRKKAGPVSFKTSLPEVPWEEDIRVKHVDRARKKEQARVDAMPTAILRPVKPDPESIADEDAAPEFLKKVPLSDSEHSILHFYREGLSYIEREKWEEAVIAFRKFLDAQPEHIYADRAAYWIAHCYYRVGDHGLAIISSNQFESRYPHSQRLPEAIYYRALSHVELGQYEEAVPELRSLLQKFPSSGLAPNASKKLAEINVQKEIETP